ncbi:MAG TPA: hypothetical protein VG269_26700 [Tepidisphaeraceae bacterium]|jgi:hypothetical protein|nr:hypothetical protein [Tepidisphaeraceae bacterium]
MPSEFREMTLVLICRVDPLHVAFELSHWSMGEPLVRDQKWTYDKLGGAVERGLEQGMESARTVTAVLVMGVISVEQCQRHYSALQGAAERREFFDLAAAEAMFT